MTHTTTNTTKTNTMNASATASITQQQSRTIAAPERQSRSLELTCETRIQAALEHARRLTQMYGCQNVDTAIAWETVEELKTALFRQMLPSASSCKNDFDRYCIENPHALECRSYDC